MGHSDDDDGRNGGTRLGASAPIVRSRRMLAQVAFDVATTAEGRAAGVSVEVWPAEGVWLRVRAGHELRLSVEEREGTAWLKWQRVDPQQSGPRQSEGELGPARAMSEEDLRRFVTRWLGWRARGG